MWSIRTRFILPWKILINKYLTSDKRMKKCSQNFAPPDKSSIDIEAIRTVFNFFFFFHEENSKHLKHKQKVSK